MIPARPRTVATRAIGMWRSPAHARAGSVCGTTSVVPSMGMESSPGRRPQRKNRRGSGTAAPCSLGLQHGQHFGLETWCRAALGKIGEEMIVVDRTMLNHLVPGPVVGQQVAAMSREVGMILEVDMHLLSRLGRQQDNQQKRCHETSGSEVHLHRQRRYEKKGPWQAVPAKIPNNE